MAAAFWNAGTLTVSYCVLNGNSANSGFGGAIYTVGSGTLTVNDSTLFGNSAHEGYGAAISSSHALLPVNNSPLRGNSTTGGFGGAIYMQMRFRSRPVRSAAIAPLPDLEEAYTGAATVANSIISGNSAGTNPDTDFVYTNNGGNLDRCFRGEPCSPRQLRRINSQCCPYRVQRPSARASRQTSPRA